MARRQGRHLPQRPQRPHGRLAPLHRAGGRRRRDGIAAGLGLAPGRRSADRALGVQPRRARACHLETLSRRHRRRHLGGRSQGGGLPPGHRLRRRRRLPDVARRRHRLPERPGRHGQPVAHRGGRHRPQASHRPRRLGRAVAEHGPRRARRLHGRGRHPRLRPRDRPVAQARDRPAERPHAHAHTVPQSQRGLHRVRPLARRRARALRDARRGLLDRGQEGRHPADQPGLGRAGTRRRLRSERREDPLHQRRHEGGRDPDRRCVGPRRGEGRAEARGRTVGLPAALVARRQVARLVGQRVPPVDHAGRRRRTPRGRPRHRERDRRIRLEPGRPLACLCQDAAQQVRLHLHPRRERQGQSPGHRRLLERALDHLGSRWPLPLLHLEPRHQPDPGPGGLGQRRGAQRDDLHAALARRRREPVAEPRGPAAGEGREGRQGEEGRGEEGREEGRRESRRAAEAGRDRVRRPRRPLRRVADPVWQLRHAGGDGEESLLRAEPAQGHGRAARPLRGGRPGGRADVVQPRGSGGQAVRRGHGGVRPASQGRQDRGHEEPRRDLRAGRRRAARAGPGEAEARGRRGGGRSRPARRMGADLSRGLAPDAGLLLGSADVGPRLECAARPVRDLAAARWPAAPT